MLTYLNGYGERVEVTNTEDIKKWYEIDSALNNLDDDIFHKYIEIIGDYVWEWKSAEHKRAYNRVYRIGKKMGFTVSELEMWYCIEEF